MASGCPYLFGQFASKEIADDVRDFWPLAFECEMPGIKQTDFGVWIVALESLGAGRQEEGIVLTPYSKNRWPSCTDVLLKFRIERDIALVVAKQIELDLVIARASEQCRIERVRFRRDEALVRNAVNIAISSSRR